MPMLERAERLRLLAMQVKARQLTSEAHRAELERLQDLGDFPAATREAEELQWAVTRQAMAEQLLLLAWAQSEAEETLIAWLNSKPESAR
jgi:hypothetical protein